jgi:mono/diheme cytochrome c family protein
LDATDIWVLALALIVPAIILWIVFFLRSGARGRPAVLLGIPRALRPGAPDEVLEESRLERLQRWGLVATLSLAFFIPAYWLGELDRQEAFAERFDEESVERGHLIFSIPPELPEETDPQAFKAVEREIALGMGCANCHGAADGPEDELALGGQTAYTVPGEGRVQWVAPPLQNVFQRWDEEIVRFTIERGRPGTPMPTWGVDYGGPMTDQMIDDVIAWLQTLPGNQPGAAEPISDDCRKPSRQNMMQCGEEIFAARCAVCHGAEGQGKETQPWNPGMALWKGDVRHLTTAQHEYTVRNGRRFAYMPQWAEAPAQGIPVPPNPLTDEQIDAVIEYERSL